MKNFKNSRLTFFRLYFVQHWIYFSRKIENFGILLLLSKKKSPKFFFPRTFLPTLTFPKSLLTPLSFEEPPSPTLLTQKYVFNVNNHALVVLLHLFTLRFAIARRSKPEMCARDENKQNEIPFFAMTVRPSVKCSGGASCCLLARFGSKCCSYLGHSWRYFHCNFKSVNHF